MKTIITLIAIITLVSCKKEVINNGLNSIHPVQELGRLKFNQKRLIGTWRYITIQTVNDQEPQIMDVGLFQEITFTDQVVYFTQYQDLYRHYNILPNSKVQGVNDEEYLIIYFTNLNTMMMIGVTSGTKWKLYRI